MCSYVCYDPSRVFRDYQVPFSHNDSRRKGKARRFQANKCMFSSNSRDHEGPPLGMPRSSHELKALRENCWTGLSVICSPQNGGCVDMAYGDIPEKHFILGLTCLHLVLPPSFPHLGLPAGQSLRNTEDPPLAFPTVQSIYWVSLKSQQRSGSRLSFYHIGILLLAWLRPPLKLQLGYKRPSSQVCKVGGHVHGQCGVIRVT